MAVAIVIDQRLQARAATEPTARTSPSGGAVAELTAAEMARLLPGVAGWALVRRDGELVATNLSRRAALLSAACVALRLEHVGGEPAGGALAHISSPQGALLGAISGQGLILAALVPGAADVPALERGMRQALLLYSAGFEPASGPGRHAQRAHASLPGRPA